METLTIRQACDAMCCYLDTWFQPTRETLTIQQAFEAMRGFLDNWYQLTKSDDLGTLLSGMQLLWGIQGTNERWTFDPALWGDWMACVQSILYPDTSEHRQALQELVADQENFLGVVQGDRWYARLLPDGRQLWAKMRSGEIRYGGIGEQPKAFRPGIGLFSPTDK